jgi:hypothetical protein
MAADAAAAGRGGYSARTIRTIAMMMTATMIT